MRDGWRRSPGKLQTKGAAKLELKLVAQNNSDYIYLTKQLQKAWSAVGVAANVTLLPSNELQVAVTGQELRCVDLWNFYGHRSGRVCLLAQYTSRSAGRQPLKPFQLQFRCCR